MLPPGACSAAAAQGVPPDVFYCLQLLATTGICTVPGSGFGQRDGTFHFRTTILPPEEDIERVCTLFSDFHRKFLAQYSPQAKL